jgi:AcrR family transcriptional regulator
MRKPRKKRAYDATGRRRTAAGNQERVLLAARRLFAERGYMETTIDAIAAEADLSAPTVYAAFGSKHGILSRLIDRLVSGEAGGPSVLSTAQARDVFAEEDPRRLLEKFAGHMAEILERVAPMYDAMKNAARSEPDVAALYARALGNRFRNLHALAERLAARGALRGGVDTEQAGRTIWAVSSPEVRQLLLAHAGWSHERYACWLATTLAAALLPD